MQSHYTVLFINAIRPATFSALEKLEQETNIHISPVVFVDKKIADRITVRNGQVGHLDKVRFITIDFDDPHSIRNGISEIGKKVDGIVCQYENSILEFSKIIPYFPELPLPSESSLLWSTEKKLMREMLEAFDPSLVPVYVEAHDDSAKTIINIESKINYPMIIKPSGLEGALLVSLVNDQEELKNALSKGFSHIQKAYDTWIKRQKPFFLAEEFMDGDMFSVDVYVDKNGNGTCAPLVEVITGKKAGYDDFFGYVRKTPVQEVNEQACIVTTLAACKALGMRSITAHVELMRLQDKRWKIIELGPRIGGYRHDIYEYGYGINHIANDIANRLNLPVIVPSEPLGYTAMYNIYARTEGIIKSINGLEEVSTLSSAVRINQLLNVGVEALFAKHNGDVVFEVSLFNQSKSQFDSDSEKVEKLLTIEIE